MNYMLMPFISDNPTESALPDGLQNSVFVRPTSCSRSRKAVYKTDSNRAEIEGKCMVRYADSI